MGQNTKRSNSFSPDDEFDDEIGDQLQHPQQRNAANARERARMRVLSKAFCRLKTTLPWVPPDTKLSKLDTLRLATSYIAHLRTMLKLTENEMPKHSVQPANMVSYQYSSSILYSWTSEILCPLRDLACLYFETCAKSQPPVLPPRGLIKVENWRFSAINQKLCQIFKLEN